MNKNCHLSISGSTFNNLHAYLSEIFVYIHEQSAILVYRQLVTAGKDIESAYWELVVKDIQDACKLFEPIYDQTDGADGYVSVEVSPRLANDTDGTVEAAKYLHKVVDRPNVYIKIPATAECVPSVKQVISLGISVNVTVSSVALCLSSDHLKLYTSPSLTEDTLF